ncbi:3-isopropylmalate dehydratase large subunit [Frankliniella fusca]|uniref:3-isopropylmalate dehydratase large subunit n=1 Tax=Frankliniella fusca TaxID=407009 RepID=A0AAE1HL00_9NEOP|nr:3-isopropylmalate dehydratase large subunit [Frankliniella fusca]
MCDDQGDEGDEGRKSRKSRGGLSRTTLWRTEGRKRRRFDPSLLNAAVLFDNDNVAAAAQLQEIDNAVFRARGGDSDLEHTDSEEPAAIPLDCPEAAGQDQNEDNGNDTDSSHDSHWSDELNLERPECEEEDEDENREVYLEVYREDQDLVAGSQSTLSFDEDDEEEGPSENFNFDAASLDHPIQLVARRTAREVLLLDLALMIRHHWNYESLIDNFKVKNLILGSKVLPTSKTELWKTVGRSQAGIVSHVYCDCGFYLGRKHRLPAVVECACKKMVNTVKAKVFITLSIRKQLEAFLSNPEIQQHFKKQRSASEDGSISDVFDGKVFKDMNLSEYDGTLVMNTDACKIGKKAKFSIVPVFLRINELAPHIRQRYIFLAGVYCDKGEPHMNAYLKPIVKELNSLASNGVKWYDHECKVERISRFRLLCYCVDGKARYQILNMSCHSSYYACTVCDFKGVFIGNTMRYPSGPHEDLPAYTLRTHQGMVADMKKAADLKKPIRGHQGYTPLVLLKDVDLVKQGKSFQNLPLILVSFQCLRKKYQNLTTILFSGAYDDLHFLYECAADTNLDLLLTEAPKVKDAVGKEISFAAMERTLDARLMTIKTPSQISRKPVHMKIKNRKQFTGTELRNFLIYYGVPLFQDLVEDSYLNHFGMLSRISFILAQQSVTQDELNEASELVDKYLTSFDTMYGIEKTRLNLHSLKHAVKSVRDLGPLWCYSTFNFESWNHRLIQNISSPKSPILQIVTRHLLQMHLELALSTSEEVSEDVRGQLCEILKRKRRSRAFQVCENIYVLGNATQRSPSAAEVRALRLENFSTNVLSIYGKALINSVEYQAKHTIKENSLSDNSVIQLKTGAFCVIEDFVNFTDTSTNQQLTGLFVDNIRTVQTPPFETATHIHQVLLGQLPSKSFCLQDSIKCPVVQVPFKNELYIIPLPNVLDID